MGLAIAVRRYEKRKSKSSCYRNLARPKTQLPRTLRGHPNPANEGQLKTGQREGPGH